MKFTWKLSILSIFIVCVDGLNNGLGRTPQMGWNSWYNFWCNYTDQMIKSSVDILIDTGLANLGYNYINLDDCWQISRDENGDIVEDPNVFPNGILPLIAFIHSKGLKFGLYSDAGYKTCAGRPGSLGYEIKDALKYAEWKVDYVKYDNCNTDGTKPEVRYPVMRDALNRTGRPMFYSLCEWGVDQPALWATDVGNSWRTTNDIGDTWDSIIDTIDQNNEYADHAGPGGWNDPDMLRLGYEKMDDEEDRSYFSLWSISKAPLIIGTDIRKMSNTTLLIYSNPEIIAINQDPLGVQGKKLKVFSSQLTTDENSLRFSYCSELEMISSRQKWFYQSETQSIRSIFNGKCLTRRDSSSSFVLQPCSSNNSNQKWIFNELSQRFCSSSNQKSHVDCNLSIRTNQSGQIQLIEYANKKPNMKRRNYCLTVEQDLEIWSGPLNDQSFAVIFLNRNSMSNETITINWKDLGWENNRTGLVRDLWLRKDIGTFQTSFTSSPLQLHQIQFVKIQPKD